MSGTFHPSAGATITFLFPGQYSSGGDGSSCKGPASRCARPIIRTGGFSFTGSFPHVSSAFGILGGGWAGSQLGLGKFPTDYSPKIAAVFRPVAVELGKAGYLEAELITFRARLEVSEAACSACRDVVPLTLVPTTGDCVRLAGPLLLVLSEPFQ